MAFLLLVVVFLIILFSFLPNYLPKVSRKVTELILSESDEDRKKKQELTELKDELRTISMVDEFPRYARTERKINKLTADLNTAAKKKSELFVIVKLIASVLLQVLQVVVFLWIIINHRHDPVADFSPDWVYPFGFLISFPTGKAGALSITFWVVVSRCAVSRLVALFCHR